MAAQRKKEKESKEALSVLHRQQEEARTRELAIKYDLPYINLVVSPIDLDALSLVTEGKARVGLFVTFQKKGEKIAMATTNPEEKLLVESIDDFKKKGFIVELFVCSMTSLSKTFEEYRKVPLPTKEIVGKIEISHQFLQKIKGEINTIEELRVKLRDVEKREKSLILESIIAAALKFNASDIHIEPSEETAKIRYRLDGVLYDIFLLERSTYNFLLSRVKLLSSMKINVHNIAQDGRFTIAAEPQEIEVRVSVVPGDAGEDIAMRILNPEMILSINDLGLHPWHRKNLLYQMKKPQGMILTCGPTGSGKTTTLYACLKYISSPGIKVITIENPIEYKLEGIQQTQADPEKGYDFASALRATLRQDPDMVLVGEIRDRETAETAIQAALTGHLVFSTLHTNDAAGIIPRLIEMGASPTSIAPAINLAIAQRLLRRICKKCAKKIAPSKDLSLKIEKNLSNLSPEIVPSLNDIKFFQAQGCSECHNSGYKGRIGIYEMFQVTDKIEEAVLSYPSISKMKKLAIEEGMITIQQDGILRVLEGITTIAELETVTGPLE
ncbi:MAG: ATPase, T2SS/T4P/T4SS family [Patescibacteria group bacterium]